MSLPEPEATSRLVDPVDPPLRTAPPSREEPPPDALDPRGTALRPVDSPPLLRLPAGRDCPLSALARCGARSKDRIGAAPEPDEDGIDGLEEDPIEPPLIPPPLDLLLLPPESEPPPPRLTAVPPVVLPLLALREPAEPDPELPDC